MQSLMNVHFSSAALAAALRERPAMLYFVFNAAVIAVIVAHDLTTGEFVAQVQLQSNPSDTSAPYAASSRHHCGTRRHHRRVRGPGPSTITIWNWSVHTYTLITPGLLLLLLPSLT